MAEDDKEKEPELVLLYAEKFGWVDVQNLQKYLDEHCCTECWVFLAQAPVGRVQTAVEKDGRIQLRVTDKPKKSASNFFNELKEKGTQTQMLSLEKVSDRSMNKGGC
ncbi:MAG: hypothetical protein ACLFQW_06600 [Spirochaetaceae bacterium]